jgi:adenine-specific DNA-methyltransferase
MGAAATRKTTLKQYFTDALEVNSAMANLLGNVDGLSLLEPSVGDGALLCNLLGSPKLIDAIDVDASVLARAKQRLPNVCMGTHCIDFIDMFVGGLMSGKRAQLLPQYDAVISNPPFGLFFSREYRKRLKSLFPNLYVRESYGLFLIFSIMMLREGGRYVFLLPDTFLTSTNHSSLRQFLYDSGEPTHVVRFPSKRFETVNFGYGNLCIIAGHKRRASENTLLTWIEAFDALRPLLLQPDSSVATIPAADLQRFISTGWRVGMGEVRSEMKDWTTLGEAADCKTGIYTWDNGRFVGYDPAQITKRLNGHSISWSEVYQNGLSVSQKEHGLDGSVIYVPLIRGGHRSFLERTAWALRWDKEALGFYKTDKKARLQNFSYYFRRGLAVPMVTSRRLSASLMDNAVFDQGVVGVFPFDEDARDAILLYLNSTVATKLRNELVNGSANNSANYLKRLPIPKFASGHCVLAKAIVRQASNENSLTVEICDNFINGFFTTQDRRSDRLAVI